MARVEGAARVVRVAGVGGGRESAGRGLRGLAVAGETPTGAGRGRRGARGGVPWPEICLRELDVAAAAVAGDGRGRESAGDASGCLCVLVAGSGGGASAKRGGAWKRRGAPGPKTRSIRRGGVRQRCSEKSASILQLPLTRSDLCCPCGGAVAAAEGLRWRVREPGCLPRSVESSVQFSSVQFSSVQFRSVFLFS